MEDLNITKEELEKLHKKALEKRVAALHRSTKTLFKFFEPLHFKLREKFSWYYRWHTSKFSTFTHWTILISAILLTVLLGFSLRSSFIEKNQIPQKYLVISGPIAGADKVAFEKEKSNIKIEKERVKIDDKKITIGVLKKKADLGETGIWKNILWSADVPQGTSIVYRVRVSDEDKDDLWEKALWSSYYPISSGFNDKNSGLPLFKGRFLEIEIVFEGNEELSPTLNYLKFGYTPFYENKTVAFLRDKLISFLGKIFRFLEKREGIE